MFSNAVLDGSTLPSTEERAPSRVAVFAGRLLAWKGVAIGISAIAESPDWCLVVYGSGPDERRLRRLAELLGVVELVEFRGWVARERVQEVMRTEADVFLFPSVHDEAGWVVVEAMAAGLPVICLNVGGPPVLIGRSGYPISIRGGKTIVVKMIAEALDATTFTARLAARERSTVFRQDVVESRLRDLVRSEFPELEI